MSDDKALGCGCLAQMIILAGYSIFGAMSVNWLLLFFAAKTIPLWAAWVIGLFGGELTIPAAIIVYLLHMFGVM